ncbi:MAG TPA: molybdenum ABC transporter ATP-binding protein [Sedimenticola thiotaurini]|uniref:Molybdenum ABC transporter ATP-binding protein n=1 Tax=Sedimenticola thiotaurini TaxID=1543721 RepID=A0A831RKI1_9GAMM|nr:molybdenum ABC transporter ATP-binding protein [Sedimenticola thiotaurini]
MTPPGAALRVCLRLRREAFHLDVDLHLPGRGVSALFGPSGCGKTTLLRAVAGLEPGAEGFLQVGDEVWQEGRRGRPPHRRAVGYVFQEASLFSHLDVRANLDYGVRRVPPGRRRVPLQRTVELLGIGHLLQRWPHQLSGGERQRVAIARALAVGPRLLLLDEPLAALDLARKREILPYLESLHDELEIPVIYVSHAPDEVARLADHMVLLQAGRETASGPVGEMLTRLDLPLARGEGAGALIEGRVAGHDDRFELTYVDFAGGRFTVARNDMASGHPVRLRVAARDVSLTLERQRGTSILNIFPARVEQLVPEGRAKMMVRLSVQGVPLLSSLTRKSADALALAPGRSVYAQVKSVAVL